MKKLILFLKGMFMGAADIIPGVSGGTIALITGIYDELIKSINCIDKEFIKDLLSLKFKKMFNKINFKFLIPIFLGILTSIFSMANLMHYLINQKPIETWSVFFGIILTSSFILSKKIKINKLHLINIVLGAIFSYFLVGIVPVKTPNTLLFLFFSGSVAICAMILPGISGAFLLLILGKYNYITEILKSPFSKGNPLQLIIFALGCLFGLLSFAKFLNHLLKRYHGSTIAFLTGLMLGSLRKIWPFKKALETKLIDGEIYTIKEKLILPWNVEVGLTKSLFFIFIGILIILTIDYFSNLEK